MARSFEKIPSSLSKNRAITPHFHTLKVYMSVRLNIVFTISDVKKCYKMF